jgi:hypothetical protein
MDANTERVGGVGVNRPRAYWFPIATAARSRGSFFQSDWYKPTP